MIDKAKPYVIGAAAAGAVLLAWRLFGGKTTKPAANLTVTGTPTKPANWYVLQADILEAAMFDAGTDEAAIFAALSELRNNADFEALFNAFGIRSYNGGMIPSPWIKANLVQWFNLELTSGEIEEANEILASNGITIQI